MTPTPATNTTSGAADLPEALRLAAAISNLLCSNEAAARTLAAAADELVRIHAESEMRRAALLDEMQKAALAAGQATAAQQPDSENLRKALQFYADSEHFIKSDGDAWDTVSGEPQNYWCDEAGTATVEDGHIARLALSGHLVRFEDDAAKPAAQQEAAYAALPDEREMLKHALWLASSFTVHRYLMSNAEGRWSGAEKAACHDELCCLYVAVFRGVEVDQVRVDLEADWMAVHDATQELTDHMDVVIGFPLKGVPDYDALAPKFFAYFHRLATHALRASHGQAPAQAASSAVLKAIREANMQLVRTGDDAFMLVPYKAVTAQAADSVTAPAPPPECETEAEKRAFAFGWFKALESERMKADNRKKDPL